MSDTPERVWIKEGYNSWGQCGHWYAHGKGGGTEYAPANHIEQLTATNKELEAKLAAKEKLMLALAGDKIDLVSELAGVEAKLAKAEGRED